MMAPAFGTRVILTALAAAGAAIGSLAIAPQPEPDRGAAPSEETLLAGIATGAGDPREAIAIPGRSVVFSDMADDSPQARALFASGLDGSNRRRLTFGPHRDTAPRLLDDGRIRFERTLAGSEAGPPLVLTIRPDGTGVARALELSFPPGPPAAGRPEPPLLTSVVNMARTTGTLLCLDVYASRLPSIAALPRGRIASVRVSAAASPEGPTLAEAPVHADGSFLVEVPADTLLALTLIGHDGAELASLRSGVWVRPNENRGCIGCHEEEDRAPANRRPLALRGRG